MKTKTKLKILAVGLAVVLTACGGAEERKAKYLEKGKVYLAEKNYEKARIEFKNVLQIDPKFADAYYYMGQIEEQNRDLQKAAGNYHQVLQLDAEYINAKVKLARIYTIVGTDEYIGNAKNLLQEVFAKQPDHAEAILVDATIDSRSGNKDQAIEKILKVIEKSATQVDAYSLLAAIYASQGKDAFAIEALKNGINNNSDAIALRMMLAQTMVKNNSDLIGAEEQLKKIIEIDPENYNYRIALATFYATSKQADKAELILREAIADDAEDPKRYLVLVEFLAGQKSVKAAEEELLSAIAKKPKFYELRFALVSSTRNYSWLTKP